MVFNISTKKQVKKDRLNAIGKLISIQADSDKCEVFDTKLGKYSWVRLALVTGKDKSGKDIFLNITASHINMNEMEELKKADEFLRYKVKPFVKVTYYESEKLAFDKDKNPINEEFMTKRDGKDVIISRQKKYKNLCASPDDIIKGFKIVSTDPNFVMEEFVR